jgi:hypothetical protein
VSSWLWLDHRMLTGHLPPQLMNHELRGSEDVTLTWLENLGNVSYHLHSTSPHNIGHPESCILGGWLGRVAVLVGVVLLRDFGMPNRLFRVRGMWFQFHTTDSKQPENQASDRQNGAETHTFKLLTGIAIMATPQAASCDGVFVPHTVG